MIAVKPKDGATESPTAITGIVLISILSATIVLYFVYLGFYKYKFG